MRQISLTKGYFAIVDDEDYDWLMQWKWHATPRNYMSEDVVAVRREPMKNGKLGKQISMYRAVMQHPKGRDVDHINHNTLDNRKSNLRVCTRAENRRNSKIYSTNKCGYKGVHKKTDKHRSKPWVAFCSISGTRTYLGHFATPEEAARAYDEAALEHHGKFALTNKSLGLLN